jgi:hypothetical protein
MPVKSEGPLTANGRDRFAPWKQPLQAEFDVADLPDVRQRETCPQRSVATYSWGRRSIPIRLP